MRKKISEWSRARFQTGTLHYSFGGLLLLFFNLLSGGFMYCMVSYVVIPTLLPLTLEKNGASGEVIGLVVGSIPAVLNFIINPLVSTRSDRMRTRWGRRIPFLAWAAPPVALFMIVLGWAPDLVSGVFGGQSSGVTALVVICLASVLFQIFNQVAGSIYYYLLPDVIPESVLGRFMALMNLSFTLAGFVFGYFLMPYAHDHMPWIYTGVGIVFLISFLQLSLWVREGDYPPPEEVTQSTRTWWQRITDRIGTFGKECFGKPFFVLLFLGTAMNQVSTVCRSLFGVLFATRELGLDAGQIGRAGSYGVIPCLVLVLLAGYLMDKLHPLRIYIAGGFLVIVMNVFGYFYVYDYNTFLVIGIMTALVYSLQSLSNLPMLVALLPKDRFGQYSAANAMFNSVLMILASWLGGKATDAFGYRFLFIWDFIFTVIASAAMLYVYREWRRNGRRSPETAADPIALSTVELPAAAPE